MAKAKAGTIPEDVRQQAEGIIDEFNRKHFPDGKVRYIGRFKGKHLFLDREEYGDKGEICRLKFTGHVEQWDFAIYKYSDMDYDPDEWLFPGDDHVDGTIEGAMFAGLEAYPPST